MRGRVLTWGTSATVLVSGFLGRCCSGYRLIVTDPFLEIFIITIGLVQFLLALARYFLPRTALFGV